MTTFESILLLAVTACVIITAFGVLVIKKMLKEIIDRKYATGETLSDIRGDTVDIFQELNNIEDNILDDDKWHHYRIQAAIAAMQGQLANDESVKQMIETLDFVALPDKTKAYMNLVARSSVMLADALIEELKKGGEQ